MAESSSDRLFPVVRPTLCFARGHDSLQICSQVTLPFTAHIPLTTIPKYPSNAPHIRPNFLSFKSFFQSLVAMQNTPFVPILWALNSPSPIKKKDPQLPFTVVPTLIQLIFCQIVNEWYSYSKRCLVHYFQVQMRKPIFWNKPSSGKKENV